MTKKILGISEVLHNSKINKFYFKLDLRLHGIKSIDPGQFINLKIDNVQINNKAKPIFTNADLHDLKSQKPFLMRPFSVGRIIKKEKEFIDAEFLLKEVGIGTYFLHHIKPGTKLQFLGPIGNNFKITDNTKIAIMIAGGTGLAPLMALSNTLKSKKIDSYLLLGGIDKDNLSYQCSKKVGNLNKIIPQSDHIIPDIESALCSTGISTDDGSLGFKGFVTDLAEKIIQSIENKNEISIFSCGPMQMMKSAHKIAEKYKISHQVSLERHMACGLGVCLSCINKIKSNDDDDWEHQRVCTDGTVFNANEVIFDD